MYACFLIYIILIYILLVFFLFEGEGSNRKVDSIDFPSKRLSIAMYVMCLCFVRCRNGAAYWANVSSCTLGSSGGCRGDRDSAAGAPGRPEVGRRRSVGRRWSGGGAPADRSGESPARVERAGRRAAGNGVIDETGQTSGRDRSLADAANTHSAAAVSGETPSPRLFAAAAERPSVPHHGAPFQVRPGLNRVRPTGFGPRSAAFEPRPPVMVVYWPHGRCTPAARPGASIAAP